MKNWSAIVPVNLGRERKTRLAAALSRPEREALASAMARHVVATLDTAGVADIALLAPERIASVRCRWIEDRGGGLNAEIADALPPSRTLVIHADLPLVTAREIVDFLAIAEGRSAAIAGDRAQEGTNALALLAPAGFTPAFGPGSLARHRELLPRAAVVERKGLALDIDTPADLLAARIAHAPGLARVEEDR